MASGRPAGEIYLPLAVGFASDPKVRALAQFGADAGLARDLFVQMCCHCKANLTDGFVAEYELGILVYPLDAEHGKQLAKHLAYVGLIKEISNGQADGWQVCSFLKRNRSREQVQELSHKRADAGRTGGQKSRKRPAQRPAQAKDKQVASTLPINLPPRDRDRDRDIQTPTASAATSAASANGLTIGQRSKRITDAYAAAEPMCKWPAVNGVVTLAIKAEKYSDEEIRDALLRMAAENRSVTVDALRTEIAGLPPRDNALSRRESEQAATDALFRRAAQREMGRDTPMGELT